ncbi:MAG: hypothetical protein JJT90_14275 [Ectothiorhodospiraceae bacterium]|nr:hypothetical protein [Ectothiorhodospiraceae bacterium]
MCCGLALTLWHMGDARSQDGVPIQVAVAIESPTLLRLWGPHRGQALERRLAAAWREILRSEFPHWDFHADPARAYAEITLFVDEPELRKIRIGMRGRTRAQAREAPLWSDTWLEPSDLDLGLRPPADQAGPAILQRGQSMFAGGNRQRVADWLKEDVPLGAGGFWEWQTTPAEPRVVTSLPWERFSPLKDSLFRVLVINDRRILLDGEGIPHAGRYQIDETAYEAVVVRPLSPNEIPDLAPETSDRFQVRLIFLKEERTPIDLEFLR